VLLYVEKKSSQLVGLSYKTSEWIEEAFRIISITRDCNKPFPLFMFGLEAHTDRKRLLILDTIDRTIQKANIGGLIYLRRLLIKAWIQNDLSARYNADVADNACPLLAVCNFVPCLI
jgi:hypothetical protein